MITRFFDVNNTFGQFLMFIGFCLFLGIYHTHFVAPRQYIQRNPEICKLWNIQCSKDGLFFYSSNSEPCVDWSVFSEIWETSEFYFLMKGKDTPTIIGKRAFISNTQEVEFRDLVKRKINPKIQRKKFFERTKTDTKEVKHFPQNPPDWR